MKRHSKPSCRRQPQGLTLVEVLVSLAILGSLLVAMLLARARVNRQEALGRQKLQAVAAAETMLASWWADPDTMPRQGGGVVAGQSELHWRVGVVENPAAAVLDAQVVRLDIVRQAPQDSSTEHQPLVRVELLLPVPANPKPSDQQDRKPAGMSEVFRTTGTSSQGRGEGP